MLAVASAAAAPTPESTPVERRDKSRLANALACGRFVTAVELAPPRGYACDALIEQARGGREYDATFGKRMTGEGAYADLIATRMRLAKARLGYAQERVTLDASAFAKPGEQFSLL